MEPVGVWTARSPLLLAVLGCVPSSCCHLVMQNMTVAGTSPMDQCDPHISLASSPAHLVCTLLLYGSECSQRNNLTLKSMFHRYTRNADWPVYIQKGASHTPHVG